MTTATGTAAGVAGTAAAAAVPGALADRYRRPRRVLSALLLAAFLTTCGTLGLPTDRVVLICWVVAALAVRSIGRGWSALARLLADWVPLGVVLVLYDFSRGLADGLGRAVHVTEPAAVDRWLGGGVLPTVWLQQHWGASWWAAVASLVYASHFVVTPVVLAGLWLRDRVRWVGYVQLVLALSAAGLVTYVLYPAAPPWLASRDGVIEHVDRISSSGWAVLGLPRAGALLHSSQGQVNPVAAVPSLHTAFAVLTCLALLPPARHLWQRVVLVSYAVGMPVVLVWSGEHYVLDTLLGALYAAAVWVVVPRAVRLLRRRRTPAPVAA
jgi:hypothetical protein